MEVGQQSKEKKLVSRWSSEDLRWYHRAMTRNSGEKEFTFSIHGAPGNIETGESLDGVFSELRVATQDGYERWTFMGQPHENLLVRAVPIVVSRDYLRATKPKAGFDHEFDRKHIQMWLKDAEEELEDIVAILHSHPKVDPKNWNIIKEIMARGKSWQDNYSAHDLYCLLVGKGLPAIEYLAGPKNNHAAFRTLETEFVTDKTQQQFADFWYGQYDWRDPIKDARRLNVDIAKEHKLVIYEGAPHSDLVRI